MGRGGYAARAAIRLDARAMDRVDALWRAYDSLEQLVRSLEPDQLAAGTPCAEWDVRAVLDHVIGGAKSFAAAARQGGQFQPVEGDHVGDDPVASLRAAADGAIAAWRDAGEPPPTGFIPGVSMLDINIADVVLHTWDIARGTGREPNLPDDVVADLLSKMEGQWHEIGHQMGAFGPPCDVPEGAAPLDRLAALTGRQQ